MSNSVTPQQEVEAHLRLQRADLGRKVEDILAATGMEELRPHYEATLNEFDRVIEWYTSAEEELPEPLEPTLQDWAKIPVGTRFGFGRQRNGPYPYYKITDHTYGHGEGSQYSRSIYTDTTVGDRQRGLHWEGQE